MEEEIILKEPKLIGNLERAINERRSVRRYSDKELTIEQLSQLLWAADGVTDKRYGFRSAPSAGATYPLELYVVIKDGIYQYDPDEHKLVRIVDGDKRGDLSAAALGQRFVREAELNIVIVAVYDRITSTYGQRGIQYALQESGHIAQNIHLQAKALGLDTCAVGAFSEAMVSKVLNLKKKETPVYIISVGYAR